MCSDLWAGNCTLTDCTHGRGWSSGYANREMLTPDGKTGGNLDGVEYTGQCFVCNNSSAGDSSCDKNDKVAIIVNNSIVKIYRCDAGDLFDSWGEYGLDKITTICGDSPIRQADVSGAVKGYRLGNSQSTSSGLNISTLLTSSQKANNLCVYYECDGNKIPNSDGSECVEKQCQGSEQRQVTCGGASIALNAGTCIQQCTANMWSAEIIYTCKSDDYVCVPRADGIGCDRCELSEEAQLRNASAQQVCENSGGTWNGENDATCVCDENKHLKQNADSSACECDDADYEYSASAKQCVLSNAAVKREACKNMAGAQWNEDSKTCLCDDETMEPDFDANKCVKTAAAALCEEIGEDKASFDAKSRKCVCKDPDKEVSEQAKDCVETKDARARREAEDAAIQKKNEQNSAKARIEEIRTKMASITDGLGVSVWKNKDGNFNTSRLASDSIAGVVLGTAGGLITSNVVKKNQIKGGFEKINCSIGGQTVAGFGDDFSVGISLQ